MMSKTELKNKLTKLDDLFTTEEDRQTQDLEKVVDINLSDLKTFKNHPFKVIDNEELNEMATSIQENGVLVPIIVRPIDDNKYEIISGHRRKRASQLAGKEKIPCIIRDLTDDEATIIMVDSNMQREKILPSEKAFAYKMKLDAMKHQGKRSDLTSTPMVEKLDKKYSVNVLAEENGESRETIRRFIRLTELIPEILEMVDNVLLNETPSMALRPAVEISYLSKDEQYSLLDIMEYQDRTPSLSQAINLKEQSKKGTLTVDYMEDLLNQDKPNQTAKLKISRNKLKDVLPKNLTTDSEIENFVIKIVTEYMEKQRLKEKSRNAR